jgi:lipopolysaccharide transport system permease protein
LIARLAWRRVQSRYRGSMLGAAWLVVQPALLLAVYTLVFSLVFEAKWGVSGAEAWSADGTRALVDDPFAFGLLVYSGVLLLSFFSDCVNEAPRLMLDHERFIVQVRFPVEILPWVSLVSSFYLFLAGAAVLLVTTVALYGLPSTLVLVFPLILIPLAFLTLGVCWFLSSLGVYFRDLSQLTVMATTALLFLSPVFYPASRVPEALRGVYALNPFATLLEGSKSLLFFGHAPDWVALAVVTFVSFAVAGLGHAWFMYTRRGFADVV